MDKSELLTAKKVAEQIGATEAKVKKVIKEMNIEADEVKCRCNYYGPATIEKIKSAIRRKHRKKH